VKYIDLNKILSSSNNELKKVYTYDG